MDEFSSLYVFHLRGNQRTSGETSRKEGGKIFGSGSRAPIAISLLVKNPEAVTHGQIYFHDIGDYLSREEKLEKIVSYASVAGIPGWQHVVPDEHGDWLKQRDNSFGQFIVLGDKDDRTSEVLFENYTRGLETGRDAWVINSSESKVKLNVASMLDFYNKEIQRVGAASLQGSKKERIDQIKPLLSNDATQISWTSSLFANAADATMLKLRPDCIGTMVYRPFTKQAFSYDSNVVHRVGQMPRIFPNAKAENCLIMVKQRPAEFGQLALMVNRPPELQTDGGTQCFPLYLYDEAAQASDDDLFAEPVESGLRRRDAITDAGLAHFNTAYPGEQIGKEDLFYYVYSILHSPDYRERYADNLSKELPRIPAVKKAVDFWAFSKAGRALAELHLNYETVAPYPLTIEAKDTLTNADYRVEKMKFAKKGDKTTVI